jgi:hypothetical protein
MYFLRLRRSLTVMVWERFLLVTTLKKLLPAVDEDQLLYKYADKTISLISAYRLRCIGHELDC